MLILSSASNGWEFDQSTILQYMKKSLKICFEKKMLVKSLITVQMIYLVWMCVKLLNQFNRYYKQGCSKVLLAYYFLFEVYLSIIFFYIIFSASNWLDSFWS